MDRMTERDEATLRAMAVIAGTNFAEQRRRALAHYARACRRRPGVAELAGHWLAARARNQALGAPNVVRLADRRPR